MKRFLHSLLFLISLHICGLVGLSFFRLMLFISGHYLISHELSNNYGLQSIAFIRGLWFDNVIACYISLLPLIVIIISFLCGYKKNYLFKFITIYIQILFGITFAISAANIPYFEYFFKNINSSIFNWFEYGSTTLKMLFEESSYYFSIGLFICILIFFVWSTKKIRNIFIQKNDELSDTDTNCWQKKIIICLLGGCLISLCIFGIRGRRGYNPIKISAAFYCEDPFLNQIGINPTFNLLTSTIDDFRPENKQLNLINENLAIRNTQIFLHHQGNKISPLYYKLNPDTIIHKKSNVIIIFMESMSANLMKTFGQQKNLTPFLDSLFHQSIGFTHFYSAGIHTNHGLYATLYSFPAIMKRNLMKGTNIPIYSGLPTVLKKNGYRNFFFMTHERQYDNMNAFLRTNGYDEIYSQENYPKDKIVNSFGVQDDFLYDYAINILNKKAKLNQPFMASILSISNHPPYVIPSWFHPTNNNIEEQIVEYADWSLHQFFEKAKKQPWFKNTIFILEADHGKKVGKPDSELPSSFNHIPLIIYSSNLKPSIKEDWCGQIDIQPTLLHLLGINATQANFGIDIFKEKRPCIFYTADDLIGARDETRLFEYNPSTKQEFLYYLSQDGKKIHITKKTDSHFKFLKKYVFSMLQTAESLVRQRKTVTEEK